MPIVCKSSFFYIFGIMLSFIFAEFSYNFPDTAYLFLTLILSIFLNIKLLERTFSFIETINFTTVFIFFTFSFYWLFKNSYENTISNFLYPFMTVSFNLLFPYFYAQGAKEAQVNSKLFYYFFVFTAAVAVWQLYAVNYLFGLDYLYRNERIKSALFQGQPRISSIFVSANNYSIYILVCFSFALFFIKNLFTKLTFLTVCTVLVYLTFVRKSYILLVLLLLIYLFIPLMIKINKKIVLFIIVFCLIIISSSLAFFSELDNDGLLSAQTLTSRYSQWAYFLNKFISSNVITIFIGDFILQSSFESFHYNVLFLDNNFLMVLTFGGLLLFIPYIITTIYFLYYFLTALNSNRQWAAFGITSWFTMAWVGMFSNLIDNHEVNFVVFGSMWLAYFKIKNKSNL
jgi:hypothetical protein